MSLWMTALRILFFVGILPCLCGLYVTGLSARNGGRFFVVRTYVYGWLILWALFEIVCVPFIVMRLKFSRFMSVFHVCLFVFVMLSVMLFLRLLGLKKKQGEIWPAPDETEPRMKSGTIILWGMVVFAVALQMIYLFFYQHYDGDDSYFIAQSVITDFFDTMFQRDSYTGMPIGLDERHALSANPIFITWLGRMCGLHPAVMAHSILAPVLILLMYLVYALVGQALFAKNRHYIPVFLLLVNVWYVWGNISIYTPETFMYTRTWQGKALFANLLVPLSFLFLYEMMKKEGKLSWVFLFLLPICGVFTTTAAVYLVPMIYGFAGLWLWVIQKKWKQALGLFSCCIPSLIYGGLYYYLLTLWRYV